MFVWVFHKLLQKNPDKLFDEPNIIAVEAEHLKSVLLAQVMDRGGRTLPASPLNRRKVDPSRAGQGSWAVTHTGPQNHPSEGEPILGRRPRANHLRAPSAGRKLSPRSLLVSRSDPAPISLSCLYAAPSWSTEVKCMWPNLVQANCSKLEVFFRSVLNFWLV